MNLSVREMQLGDIENIVDYFICADDEFLKGMGADKTKLPKKQIWIEKLKSEFKKSYTQKEFYYIIWEIDNKPLGHSNINNIFYGKSATMHLHLWNKNTRGAGLELLFLKLTFPFYFENYNIEKLICEPFSGNEAPNIVLRKAGFQFIKTYDTVPGWINFHQIVNRYELTKDQYLNLGHKK